MTTLRNINPIGQADVPLIGRQGEPLGEPGTGCLEPGEEFQCSPAQARLLLAQTSNYEPADADAQQIADELRAEAEQAAQTEPGTSEDVTAVEVPLGETGISSPPAADGTNGEVQ